MHLSGGMDFPVLLSCVQTHQPQQLNAGSFERCSPECSGSSRVSTEPANTFVLLELLLCAKAFNDCVPFFIPFQTVRSVCRVLPAAGLPATQPLCLWPARGQGDPITISRTAKDYIAPLHLKTSRFNKNVKPFSVWEFACGPKSASMPCKGPCPECWSDHK